MRILVQMGEMDYSKAIETNMIAVEKKGNGAELIFMLSLAMIQDPELFLLITSAIKMVSRHERILKKMITFSKKYTPPEKDSQS